MLTKEAITVFRPQPDAPAGFQSTQFAAETSRYTKMCTDGQHLYLAAKDGSILGDGGTIEKMSVELKDGEYILKETQVICEKGDWGKIRLRIYLLTNWAVQVQPLLCAY